MGGKNNMKYTIQLEREEYYLLLGALHSDADRQDRLSQVVSDEDLCRELASLAEKERVLRSKIIETRKVII